MNQGDQNPANNGSRSTAAKRASEKFISETHRPFSANDLLEYLHEQGLKVNVTTVYRQLNTMLSQDLLQEVNLNDGVIRYEQKHDHCHHHVVCTQCGKVEHVELDDELSKLQQKLSHDTGFQIEEHMLEFFGKCKKCAN